MELSFCSIPEDKKELLEKMVNSFGYDDFDFPTICGEIIDTDDYHKEYGIYYDFPGESDSWSEVMLDNHPSFPDWMNQVSQYVHLSDVDVLEITNRVQVHNNHPNIAVDKITVEVESFVPTGDEDGSASGYFSTHFETYSIDSSGNRAYYFPKNLDAELASSLENKRCREIFKAARRMWILQHWDACVEAWENA